MVWRRVLAAAVLVPVVLLGGCGTDEPTVRPSSTTSEAAASPTPSPSPTLDLTRLPEQPAAMAEPTTDGAIAAATYVLELYTYAFASGDASPWRAITSDTCEFCLGVAEAVNGMVEQQHSSTGSPFTVSESSAVEISEDQWFSVEMVADQTPSRRVDRDGVTVAENPGGRFRVVFALSWSDARWHVDQMGFERLDETAAAGS